LRSRQEIPANAGARVALEEESGLAGDDPRRTVGSACVALKKCGRVVALGRSAGLELEREAGGPRAFQKRRGEVKRRHLFICWVVSIWILGGTGCSMSAVKEQNRRLKESNDRLISENNRLEEELAALQKKLSSPDRVTEVTSLKTNDPGRDGARVDADKDLLLLDDEVEVRKTPQGVTFRVPDRIFFALGQATLSVRGQRILEKVARIIDRDYPNRLIRVEGHTDDTPIRKVRHLYPTNWELSTARACTVVRFLVERCNVNAHRIYPAGFSYYRPTTNAKSPAAKSQNRRVEITVLNETT